MLNEKEKFTDKILKWCGLAFIFMIFTIVYFGVIGNIPNNSRKNVNMNNHYHSNNSNIATDSNAQEPLDLFEFYSFVNENVEFSMAQFKILIDNYPEHEKYKKLKVEADKYISDKDVDNKTYEHMVERYNYNMSYMDNFYKLLEEYEITDREIQEDYEKLIDRGIIVGQ